MANQRLGNRVFAYFMGTAAANAQYAYQYFGNHEQEPVLAFCQQMARDLIYNKWCPKEEQEPEEGKAKDRKRHKAYHCKLVTLPPFKKFCGAEIVDCVRKCNRKQCKCQKNRVRTYCMCSPGVHRCDICFPEHIHAVTIAHGGGEMKLVVLWMVMLSELWGALTDGKKCLSVY